jgi:hypothetical protein
MINSKNLIGVYKVWLFHLGTSCTVFVLICTVVVLNGFVICVCVCLCVCGWVGFVMYGCLDNGHSLNLFGYPD